MGLRQGSAGATMVQSFSENVLEAQRTNSTQQLHRQAEVSGKFKLKESFYGWLKTAMGGEFSESCSFNQCRETFRAVFQCTDLHVTINKKY